MVLHFQLNYFMFINKKMSSISASKREAWKIDHVALLPPTPHYGYGLSPDHSNPNLDHHLWEAQKHEPLIQEQFKRKGDAVWWERQLWTEGLWKNSGGDSKAKAVAKKTTFC
jgi:hypothetical protein